MPAPGRSLFAAFSASLLLLAPRLAEACYVCTSGRGEDTRLAFQLTTVFLSVLPLLIVGGFVWYLRRRARALGRGGRIAVDPP